MSDHVSIKLAVVFWVSELRGPLNWVRKPSVYCGEIWGSARLRVFYQQEFVFSKEAYFDYW